MGIYPPKSVQVNFLWGRNDVRTAIEHEFEGLYLPKNFIPPQKKFWLRPCKKGRALVIAPQVDTATTEALRYMARTKQRRTYLP